MKYQVNYLKPNSIEINGIMDDAINFILKNQLKEKTDWKRFVEVFKTKEDSENKTWKGEFFGKQMRGACLVYKYKKDKALYDLLTNTVKDLLATQDKKGRISTYSVDDEFHGWDLWCRKYVLVGLLYYYDICDDEDFKKEIIEACKKHLDYVISKIGKEEGKISITTTSSFWGNVNSCTILEPTIELYKITKLQKYLNFAEYIISTGGCKDCNLVELALENKLYPYQYPVTKAYEMMSFYEGLLAYYEVTDDDRYFKAVTNFVEKVYESDITIIGSAGCTHELFDNSAITQTEPKDNIMQETCVTVTWMRLLSRLYQLTMNAKYIDRIEQSGFNALYGSLNNHGAERQYEPFSREFIKPKAFDSYSPLYMNKRGRGVGGLQYFNKGGYYGCCIAIGAAGLALLPLNSVMIEENNIIINNLFLGEVSLPNGASLSISNNKITINCKKKFKYCIKIRIPSWAKNARINNQEISQKGYFLLEGPFENKDEIDVNFKKDLGVHRLGGKVAFTYGPYVLAFDSEKSDRDIERHVFLPENLTYEKLQPENDEQVRILIHLADEDLLLTDYQSCGKNWHSDNPIITVWLNELNRDHSTKLVGAKRIWRNKYEEEQDIYVEFYTKFSNPTHEKLEISIIADSNYAIYLNEKLIGFAECSDYPDYKVCRTHKFLTPEKDNNLKIVVWYYGIETTQKYKKDTGGLKFAVRGSKGIVVKSDSNVKWRLNTHYKNNYKKIITSQLGYSFFYDNSISNQTPYQDSIERDGWDDQIIFDSLIPPLDIKDVPEYKCTPQIGGYLIDLGKEVCGFLDFDFSTKVKQKLTISYSEHLVDGRVPRYIGDRDFSVEYISKPGVNLYLNPFRRIACRYLFVECLEEIDIFFIGVRRVQRSLKSIPHKFRDNELQRIYDASVYTLVQTMHEHYEDSPWREQCLYALDSRNEMLSGYHCFEDYKYAKENILLLSHSLTKQGVLDICAPCDSNLSIPSFSLIYVLSVYEYIQYSGDKDILNYVGTTLKTIITTFDKRVEDNGLILNFEAPCWNFYEWTDYSDAIDELMRKNYIKKYDLILNCLYVIARDLYNEMFPSEKVNLDRTRQCIKNTFYQAERGLFKLSTFERHFSILGNSLAILAGIGGKEVAHKMLNDKGLIDISTSMNSFLYDALLKVDKRGYKKYILNDIKKKYLPMANGQSGCMWETAKGWEDFGGAGSLCHGWSAIAIHYLIKLH